VFTHLPINAIVRCMSAVANALAPDGRFFASWFEAREPAWLAPLVHAPGDVVTHYDRDPFHYAFAEIEWMARLAHLRATRIGDWNHPRGQQMASFTRDD
jgi:hypothetical protein